MQVPPMLEHMNLGEPHAYFRIAQRKFYILIPMFLCLVLGSLGVAFRFATLWHAWIIIGYGGLSILGCVALFQLWQDWQHDPIHICIYTYGLVVEYHTGTQIIPWTKVQAIQTKAHLYDTLTLMLTIQLHQSLSIRAHMQQHSQRLAATTIQALTFSELIQYLEKATRMARLQYLHSLYRAGHLIDFQQFQMSQIGMHVRQAMIPWTHIAAISISGDTHTLGIISVGSTHPWRFLNIADIPNRDLLYALIAEYHPNCLSPERA